MIEMKAIFVFFMALVMSLSSDLYDSETGKPVVTIHSATKISNTAPIPEVKARFNLTVKSDITTPHELQTTDTTPVVTTSFHMNAAKIGFDRSCRINSVVDHWYRYYNWD